MGVVVTYVDHAGTATLNTDLKLSLSADNGSNYTLVTLVAQPNFATGIKMAKANDVVPLKSSSESSIRHQQAMRTIWTNLQN